MARSMSKNVKGIHIPISGDTSTLGKALQDAEQNIRNLNKEMKEVEKTIKFNPENIELMGQKYRVATDQVDQLSHKLKTMQEADKAVKDQLNSGDITQARYDEFRRAVIDTEKALEKYKTKQADANQAMADSQAPADVLVQSMKTAKQEVISFSDVLKASVLGDLLSKGIQTAISAIKDLGETAIESAISFESSFAGVEKTIDGTKEEISALREEFIQMSKEIPQSVDSINEVASLAGQFGIEVKNITGFTEAIIGLSEATNLTAEQGAMSLAQFANITNMAQDDFDRLGSSVVALGNAFATQESTIVNMAQRFAGAGTAAGLTEDAILGITSAVASLGISEQIGGTSLSKIFSDLQIAVETSSDRLEAFATVANMTASEFTEAFQTDASQAFLAFTAGLADVERTGKSTIVLLDELGFKEAGVSRVLQGLAGNTGNLAKALTISSQAWEENIALQDEVNIRYKTTESQLEMISNRMVSVAREVGERVLPSIVSLGDTFVKFIEENEAGLVNAAISIANFTGSIIDLAPKTIPVITGLAAAFASLKITTVLSAAVKAVSGFALALTAGTPSVVGFGVAIHAALGSIGLISAAIGVVVAAFTFGSKAIKKYKEEQEELRQSTIYAHESLTDLENSLEGVRNKQDTFLELTARYEELTSASKDRQKTEEELIDIEAELLTVREGLISISGDQILAADFENGLLAEKIEKTEKLMGLEERQLEVAWQKELASLKDRDISGEYKKVIEELKESEAAAINVKAAMAELTDIYIEYDKVLNDSTKSSEEKNETLDGFRKRVIEIDKSFGSIAGYNWHNIYDFFSDDLISTSGLYSEHLFSIETNTIRLTAEKDNLRITMDKLEESIDDYNKSLTETKDGTSEEKDATVELRAAIEDTVQAMKSIVEQAQEMGKGTKDFVDSISDQADELKVLNGAYGSISSGIELNEEQIYKLMKAYPELSDELEKHGMALFTNKDIFSEVTENIRSGRQINIESAIIESNATIKEMEMQAAAAKESYGAILKAMLAVSNARSKQVGIDDLANNRLQPGYLPGDLQAIAKTKEAREKINAEIKMAKENKKILEAALNDIKNIDVDIPDTKSSSSSARVAKEKEIVNELFKLEWELYQNEKKYNELSLEDSLEKLEIIKSSTMATGADLEKIELEQHQIREKLQQEEITSINEFGDAVTEARKKQVNQVFDGQKEKMKSSAKMIKSILYEEIDLESEVSKVKLRRIDDEYWAKSKGILQEQLLETDLQELIEDSHFSRLTQIEVENLAKLEALNAEIDKHWEIITLTDAALAKDLQENDDKIEALNEEEKSERELLETKRNMERELAIEERIQHAETDEERIKALEEMEAFKEELGRQERNKERQAEKEKLKEERIELTKEAKRVIDKELEDIESIVSAQEAGLKRISESVGVEQIEELENKLSDYIDGAEIFAAELIKSGEEGQIEALRILETYYPDWTDKGKKFVDYLTEGMKEKMPDLIAQARRMGEEAGTAFSAAFNSASDSNQGNDIREAVLGAFDFEGVQPLSAAAPVLYSSARHLGVTAPSSNETNHSETKETIINYYNTFSGQTVDELPSQIERVNRQNNRQLKYDLGVVT